MANVLQTIFQWLGYAQYNATPPVATTPGQTLPWQCDINGNILVNVVAAAGSGASPWGPPLTGSGTLLTGSQNYAVDLTAGDVTYTLLPGATDGEVKRFLILAAASPNTHAFTLNSQGGAVNLYSPANDGAPEPSLAVAGPTPIATGLSITWVGAANGGAGGWFTMP